MKTVITVTERHLAKQRAGDCYSCAVALALNEMLDPALSAYVLNAEWRLLDEYERRLLTRPLPNAVRLFINVVDRSPETPLDLPFVFDTDIPRKYRRVESL